jgi:replication-associated recombination protein RarA
MSGRSFIQPAGVRFQPVANIQLGCQRQAMSSLAHNRVMIIGQPGSGKSTLAQVLGECTGLPVINIDKIHWQAKWVERRTIEKSRLCQEAAQKSRWILRAGIRPLGRAA